MAPVRGVLLLALLLPIPAEAFECTRVKRNDPSSLSQVWQQRCIPYSINRGGGLFASEANRAIVRASFARWAIATCNDLEFRELGETTQTGAFFQEEPKRNVNAVAAIESQAELDELVKLGMWGDQQLVAVTLTRYAPATGEIVDADILLNSVKFSFEDVAPGTVCRQNEKRHDLENTLVHEIGHFLGFDHVLDPDATMFASAVACETVKRDLAPDDESAVCTTYPKGKPSAACTRPTNNDYEGQGTSGFRRQCENRDTSGDGGGLSCATGSAAWWAALALLAWRRRAARPDGTTGR